MRGRHRLQQSLNGDAFPNRPQSQEEEIYKEIPPGHGTTNGGNKVCRLMKALYGLKKIPCAWFGSFT